MKKTLSILLAGLLYFVPAQAQSNVVVAEQFVKAITTEKYAEAATLFDPSLTQVNEQLLKATWEQLNTAFGGYQSYYIPEGTDQNAISLVMGLRFGQGNRGFTCNFNEAHQLTGFVLSPAPPDQEEVLQPSRFPEEERTVPVSGGDLKGTLMYPAEKTATMPVALIIAGSGATDRNCNNLPMLNSNAYKMLAEELAANGIASFRYDKRLVGASTGFSKDESKLRFEDYVQDAVVLLQYLKRQGYTKIFILGHSEGALIGTLAAQQVKVDAFVSLCGGGENISLTLKRQMNNPEANKVIDALHQGRLTKEVPSSLQVAFRASVQPYLISWMKYEPAGELAKLRIPVLIVGGTTDLQVPEADANRLKQAAPDATLMIITGMNHLLKDAPADRNANLVTYNQPDLPLNKELTAGLIRFLQSK